MVDMVITGPLKHNYLLIETAIIGIFNILAGGFDFLTNNLF